jgi:hypothetical protein
MAGGTSPSAARLWLADASQLRLDLLAAYLEDASYPELRVSLAYLLILSENASYLSYAVSNGAEVFESHELGVWRFLLHSEDSGISGEYRKEMYEALERMQLIYTRILVAERTLTEGEASTEVVGFVLDLMDRELPWGAHAYHMLNNLSPSRRAELLLPFLNSESARAAHASYVLALMPEHRPEAVACLQKLKTSKDQGVVDAAKKALAMLEMDGAGNLNDQPDGS